MREVIRKKIMPLPNIHVYTTYTNMITTNKRLTRAVTPDDRKWLLRQSRAVLLGFPGCSLLSLKPYRNLCLTSPLTAS